MASISRWILAFSSRSALAAASKQVPLPPTVQPLGTAQIARSHVELCAELPSHGLLTFPLVEESALKANAGAAGGGPSHSPRPPPPGSPRPCEPAASDLRTGTRAVRTLPSFNLREMSDAFVLLSTANIGFIDAHIGVSDFSALADLGVEGFGELGFGGD